MRLHLRGYPDAGPRETTVTGCAHARFSGTCPACQRAQQARERLHLAQATSRGLRQHHAEPPA